MSYLRGEHLLWKDSNDFSVKRFLKKCDYTAHILAQHMCVHCLCVDGTQVETREHGQTRDGLGLGVQYALPYLTFENCSLRLDSASCSLIYCRELQLRRSTKWLFPNPNGLLEAESKVVALTRAMKGSDSSVRSDSSLRPLVNARLAPEGPAWGWDGGWLSFPAPDRDLGSLLPDPYLKGPGPPYSVTTREGNPGTASQVAPMEEISVPQQLHSSGETESWTTSL